MNPKLSLNGRIYTLSTGGAHSRLLAHIANPTSPPYVGTQLSSVPHTATVEMPCLQHCSTNSKLCILLVKAQPCTPSTWPLSPTRLGIRPRDLHGSIQRIYSWPLWPFCCFQTQTCFYKQASVTTQSFMTRQHSTKLLFVCVCFLS